MQISQLSHQYLKLAQVQPSGLGMHQRGAADLNYNTFFLFQLFPIVHFFCRSSQFFFISLSYNILHGSSTTFDTWKTYFRKISLFAPRRGLV